MKHCNRMKKTSLAAFMLMMAIGMIGCGDTKVQQADSLESESQVSGQDMEELTSKIEYDECTLTFSCWEEEAQHTALKRAVRSFEEEYPGIQVELITNSEAEYKQQLLQQFEEGMVCDVVQVTENLVYELSAADKLFADLYYQEEALELAAFDQKILDRCTFKERLQMLPADINGKVFLWNETLFKKAGVQVPKTVLQLKKAGAAFADKLGDNYYPLAMDLQDRMNFLLYYLEAMYGKNWMIDGVLQYRVEEIAAGLEFMLSLEEAHVIPHLNSMSRDEQSEVSVEGGWREGTYAGAFIYSSQLEEYKDNVPVGAVVAADEVLSSMGDYIGGYAKVEKAYAISENCEHKREASLLIHYLLNQEDIVSAEGGLEFTLAEQIQEQVVFTIDPKLESLMNQEEEVNCSAVFRGFFYGDYNATEAAQLLTDKIQSAYEKTENAN